MILLVGPSASGKTEIAKCLGRFHDIKKATTHTSRLPRDGERDGVDYYFVDDKTFEQMKEADAFVETTFYNNHYYGCSKKEVADDRCVVLDPNGIRNFLKLNDPHIVVFLLVASEETRRDRMAFRGDKKESIEERIKNDRIAFDPSRLDGIDYVIQTEGQTIEELSQKVLELYQKALQNR